MKSSFAAILAGLGILSSAAARADTFVLHTGGRVDGTLLNATESPRTTYIIRTASGGEVTLKRDQVKEVRKVKPGEADYAKLRPQFPDTVDGQWRLAEWCRERGLTEVRKRHLERVIELDPEHEKARQALGYAKVEGAWKTRDEVFEDRGMVKDEAGRYRVKQQIVEKQREREQDKLRKDWAKKINLWRKWLDTDRSEEALAELQKINAPEAVPALRKWLKPDGESVEAIRKMYIDALARIGTPDAWQTLTLLSLEDNQQEIRLTCLDYVAKQPNTGAVGTYIRRLNPKNNSNEMINRAGMALGRMKDPTAVRPLMDALITTHEIELSSSGNTMNPTFGSGPGGGGGSFTFGGSGRRFENRPFENPAVRDALVTLTGQDFGYDIVSWRRWMTSQQKTRPAVDARRD